LPLAVDERFEAASGIYSSYQVNDSSSGNLFNHCAPRGH
jgi:hypothetical protein